MSWQIDPKDGDIVYSGWEAGIASSPHKGVANIQAGNIATETGEVMCSYSRTLQTQANSTATGIVSALDASHIQLAGNIFPMAAGWWITISGSTITGLADGVYYILRNSGGGTSAQVATSYNGAIVGGLGVTGSATYTILRNMGRPLASATEPYNDGSATQYRYYILDANGLVWVYDTAVADSSILLSWFLPDKDLTFFSGMSAPTGMAILNGWLHVLAGNIIWCKLTVTLGDSYASFASGPMLSIATTNNPHFAFTGHQGKLYYCDGNFLGSVFPNSSLITGGANIQSYAKYTTSTTTGTVTVLIGGSLPTFGGSSTTRIPALFFHSTGGANPTALTAGTIYYIDYSLGAGTFQVFAAATGGSALDITTGASGTQYFDTYNPISAGGKATITFSPERLNLPFFEISQSIAELGSTLIIGCRGNTAYPWNQVDTVPGDLIALPEANVSYMLTVNNMVYMFVGYKGNIYITSGSAATQALTVPDYTSGLVEPYFIWGGAMYLRGRVYFSVLDQTASHTGQCGGVWSFIPTQNFYQGQDQGIALRLENRSSYGTYNGYATVLLANQDQSARGPQYWSGWQSSLSSITYGIDYSDTVPSTPCVVQTDVVPTGTALDKETFSQIEYKLSAPLASGDSVAMAYRLNLTDAFAPCGNVKRDSATALSGFFSVNFQKTQWLQLQATLTPNGSSNSSFVRLAQIRVR